MKAMVLPAVTNMRSTPSPLRLTELAEPSPTEGELLIRVLTCGVCHTELDEIEGRTPPASLPVVPGHEVVGIVEAAGSGVPSPRIGERVGVGWIYRSNGQSDENLSPNFVATGRDVNGGYAEYMCVPENYAYPIPDVFSDAQAAPLLCAGAIGFRALNLTRLGDGQSLGMMGFGASAHLMLQTVRRLHANLFIAVFAREKSQREFALQLGADWAGEVEQLPPHALHAIVDTTPAWKPVVESLAKLRPGGRLVINAIRKEDSDRDYLHKLSYEHHLWMEKEIKTVANITHNDIRDFLPIAAEIPLQPRVQEYALDQANEALQAVRRGGSQGAHVLRISH
ncbi:MAG: alcohol dehydrogenase catalytic domain-containing protein [bacterium]|nr:alcohol dehydrogenase catalytic domain-containing protein [bacterium]